MEINISIEIKSLNLIIFHHEVLSIVFCLISINHYCGSQSFVLTGSVRNQSGEVISYASIGIENEGIGCISNSNGEFKLFIPDSMRQKDLTISHVSYQRYRSKIKDVKIEDQNNVCFVLKENIVQVPEISISIAKIKKLRNRGIRIPGGTLYLDSIGEEAGVLFNLKSSAILERIRIPILECTCDSVLIRINIYQITDNEFRCKQVQTTTMHKMVVSTHDKMDLEITPSVEPYLNAGRLAITIELIEIYGKGNLLFPVYSAHSLHKKNVLDKFNNIPFSMGLCAEFRM